MMLPDHGVTCTLVNIALLRHKVLAPWCTFHPSLGTRSHIDASPHGEAQNVFGRSVARLTIRPYVIPEVMDLDSFVSAAFASVYGLALQDLRHRGSLLESSRQYIAGGAPGLTALGELQDSSLGELGSTSLGELARELQAGLARILAWAGGISGCCGGVLKVQPPQVLQSGSSCMDRPTGFSALAPHTFCAPFPACILQE